MHRKMVKSDLISGGHIQPGPNMVGYENLAEFCRGRIWYQVQPYLHLYACVTKQHNLVPAKRGDPFGWGSNHRPTAQ